MAIRIDPNFGPVSRPRPLPLPTMRPGTSAFGFPVQSRPAINPGALRTFQGSGGSGGTGSYAGRAAQVGVPTYGARPGTAFSTPQEQARYYQQQGLRSATQQQPQAQGNYTAQDRAQFQRLFNAAPDKNAFMRANATEAARLGARLGGSSSGGRTTVGIGGGAIGRGSQMSMAGHALNQGTPFSTFGIYNMGSTGGRGNSGTVNRSHNSDSRDGGTTGIPPHMLRSGGYGSTAALNRSMLAAGIEPGGPGGAADQARMGTLGYQARGAMGLPMTEGDMRSMLMDNIFGENGEFYGGGGGIGGLTAPSIHGGGGAAGGGAGLGGMVEQGIGNLISNPGMTSQEEASLFSRLADDISGSRTAREGEIRRDYGSRGLGGGDLEAAALRGAAEGADNSRREGIREIGLAKSSGRRGALERALGLGSSYLNAQRGDRRSDLALMLQLIGL